MSEKCFCHLNGYKVKDADARAQLSAHDVAIKGLSEGMNEHDVAITETSESIATLKEGKVDKVLQPQRVYATNNHGQTSAIQYTQAPTPNTIAQRGLNGELTAADPIQEEDVANKRYVDSKLSGGTVYRHIITISSNDYKSAAFEIISKSAEVINTIDKLRNLLATYLTPTIYCNYSSVNEDLQGILLLVNLQPFVLEGVGYSISNTQANYIIAIFQDENITVTDKVREV